MAAVLMSYKYIIPHCMCFENLIASNFFAAKLTGGSMMVLMMVMGDRLSGVGTTTCQGWVRHFDRGGMTFCRRSFSRIVCHLGSKFAVLGELASSLGQIFHPRFQISRRCQEQIADIRVSRDSPYRLILLFLTGVCPLERGRMSVLVHRHKREISAIVVVQYENPNENPIR